MWPHNIPTVVFAALAVVSLAAVVAVATILQQPSFLKASLPRITDLPSSDSPLNPGWPDGHRSGFSESWPPLGDLHWDIFTSDWPANHQGIITQVWGESFPPLETDPIANLPHHPLISGTWPINHDPGLSSSWPNNHFGEYSLTWPEDHSTALSQYWPSNHDPLFSATWPPGHDPIQSSDLRGEPGPMVDGVLPDTPAPRHDPILTEEWDAIGHNSWITQDWESVGHYVIESLYEGWDPWPPTPAPYKSPEETIPVEDLPKTPDPEETDPFGEPLNTNTPDPAASWLQNFFNF
jgi:hypothetical protein